MKTKMMSLAGVVLVFFVCGGALANETENSDNTGETELTLKEKETQAWERMWELTRERRVARNSDDYNREVRRRYRKEIRHQSELVQLYKIMQKEGTEYSEQKFLKYQRQSIIGVLLSIGGGMAMAAAMGIGLSNSFDGASGEWDELSSEQKKRRASGIALLAGGATALVTGIILTNVGGNGLSRQNVLLNKEKILQGAPRSQWSLSLHRLAKGGAMSVSFTF